MTIKTIKGKHEIRVEGLNLQSLKKAEAYEPNALKVVNKDKEVQFELCFSDRTMVNKDCSILNIDKKEQGEYFYLEVEADAKLTAIKLSKYLKKIETQAEKACKDFDAESATIEEI